MPDHHPIAPPQWLMDAWQARIEKMGADVHAILSEVAQWGYDQRGEVNEAKLQQSRDQQLEACCDWLDYNCPSVGAHHLRAALRPKPPSLKQQALKAAHIELDPDGKNGALIIRALEALPND